MPMLIDLTGKKFGMLTVIDKVQSEDSKKSWQWICKCQCGNKTKPLSTGTLERKTTTSCGCRRDQYEKIRGSNSTQFTGYKENQ